jgi:hypothetical protein
MIEYAPRMAKKKAPVKVVDTRDFVDGHVKVRAEILDNGCVRFGVLGARVGVTFGLGADVLSQLALAAARVEGR